MLDCHKLNQVVTSISAVVLDVVSFLEKVNISLGTRESRYAATDVENDVFSIPIHNHHQKQLSLNC